MAKELEVTTGDHGSPTFDKSDHRVAKRRRLPGFRGDATLTVDRVGDLAITCRGAAIDSSQHQPQPGATLRRHARIQRHRLPLPGAPEPDECFDPSQRVGVKRDQRGYGAAGFCTRTKDQLRGGRTVMEGVTSFGTFTVFAGAFQWRRPARRQELRDRHQGEHGRVGGRGPKHGLRLGGQVWPGREIATPNAVAPHRSRALPPHLWTPARDSVCGSLRSDEDIPRQGLRQKAHRKTRSCQDRAIEMLRASCSSPHRRCIFEVGRIAGRSGSRKALMGHRAMSQSHHRCIRPASVLGSA